MNFLEDYKLKELTIEELRLTNAGEDGDFAYAIGYAAGTVAGWARDAWDAFVAWDASLEGRAI